jgi:hypothetical protein
MQLRIVINEQNVRVDELDVHFVRAIMKTTG